MPIYRETDIDNLLPLTRATSGWYNNAAGLLTEAPSGIRRSDYDTATLAWRGVRVEEAATNLVPNPRAEGAVVAGALPTGWPQIGGGLTAAVTWIGLLPDGWPGIEFLITGTSTGSTQILHCAGGNPPPITAAPSVGVWSARLGIEVLSATGCTIKHGLNSLNATGGIIGSNSVQGSTITAGTAYARSELINRTLTNASTAGATTGIRIDGVTNGVAVSARVRMALPQLFATSILYSPSLPPVASPGASLRAADNLSATDNDLWFSATVGTFALDFMPGQSAAPSQRGLLALDDGTGDNVVDVSMLAASNTVRLTVVAAGSPVVASLDAASATALTRHTLRLSYGPAGYLMSLNGAAPVTAAGAVPAGLSAVRVGRRHQGTGGHYLNGWVGPRFAYVPVQYTDVAAADGRTIRDW